MIINPDHYEDALLITIKIERKFIEEHLCELGILAPNERVEDFNSLGHFSKVEAMVTLSRELGELVLEKLDVEWPDEREVFALLDVID